MNFFLCDGQDPINLDLIITFQRGEHAIYFYCQDKDNRFSWEFATKVYRDNVYSHLLQQVKKNLLTSS